MLIGILFIALFLMANMTHSITSAKLLAFSIREHSPQGTFVGHLHTNTPLEDTPVSSPLSRFSTRTSTRTSGARTSPARSAPPARRFHLLSITPSAAAPLFALNAFYGNLSTAREAADFDREGVCATAATDGDGTGPKKCAVEIRVYDALDGGVLTAEVEIVDVNDSPPRYSYVKCELSRSVFTFYCTI